MKKPIRNLIISFVLVLGVVWLAIVGIKADHRRVVLQKEKKAALDAVRRATASPALTRTAKEAELKRKKREQQREQQRARDEGIITQVKTFLRLNKLRIDNIFIRHYNKKVNVTIEGFSNSYQHGRNIIQSFLELPVKKYIALTQRESSDGYSISVTYVWQHSDDWAVIYEDGKYSEIR